MSELLLAFPSEIGEDEVEGEVNVAEANATAAAVDEDRLLAATDRFVAV